MPAVRRIVQIAVSSPMVDSDGAETPPYLFALCDDATVWWLAPGEPADEWGRLPGIPQPEQKPRT